MDGWMDGRTDGRTDRQIDRYQGSMYSTMNFRSCYNRESKTHLQHSEYRRG